jgi:2-oxoglutarate dehydrogenase E1 component
VAMTQPAMQRRIERQRVVVDRYADELVQEGLLSRQSVLDMRCAVWEDLVCAEESLGRVPAIDGIAKPSYRPRTEPAKTAVPLPHLIGLLQKLSEIPAGLSIHPQLRNLLDRWRALGDVSDAAVDWCLAENLAYASLLVNGYSIRLTGMDVGRGSFYHRHAAWHDQRAPSDGDHAYYPLRNIAARQGAFAMFDTPLSEEAVLGFEYGYSLRCGRDIVLWEAQLGDFVNNAQVIVDQYIACGAAKWGNKSRLVVLLPHGYEGVGPEHSSAYPGRFLSLCAEDNLRIAMPTTSAQLFHLLRRHALADESKPLIVFTGKGALLRDAASHAGLGDFAQGAFRPLITSAVNGDARKVERVVVTCGKVYYDLLRARSKQPSSNVALMRVEQLYPFPTQELASALARYSNLRQVAWAQEEAKNHGPWHFVREHLESTLPPGCPLVYAGRPESAASAVCKVSEHLLEQASLVAHALGGQDVLRERRYV